MNDDRPQNPPLIVLCSHRSGSSAFMGLIQEAGLFLGELLPSAQSNPRGFMENRDVVAINSRLLNDHDRDWTCPPPILDHRGLDLEPLKEVERHLRQGNRPWGFKDPRTLFTLPAWAAALGPVRLVGVHRNTEDIAQSLMRRDGFDLDHAKAIARAYAERLAEAHRRFQFPIVSFDTDPAEFVSRAAQLAEAMGLQFDPGRLKRRFDPRLVHHRSGTKLIDSVDEYLAEAAEFDAAELLTVTSASIVRTWDTLPSDATHTLPFHLGPSFANRRNEMFRQSQRYLQEISAVVAIESEAREIYLRNRRIRTSTLSAVIEKSHAGDGVHHERYSHVIAPELLDSVPPSDLIIILESLSSLLEPKGLIALGGWLVGSPYIPGSHEFQPAGVKAWRNESPYLHHIDEISLALISLGLHAVALEQTPGGRSHLYLSNDPSLDGEAVTPPQLRLALASANDDIEALREERLTAQSNASHYQEEVARLRRDLDESSQEVRRLTAAVDAAYEAQKNLDDRLARSVDEVKETHQQLEVRDRELAETQQSQARLRERLEKTEKTLAAVRRSYDRLAQRRLVRLALWVAQLARPVFRLLRLSANRKHRHGRASAIAVPSQSSHPRRSRREVIRAFGQRPIPHPTSGPLVSVIVLTRDGAQHLSRLFRALDVTLYRSFEVIVVDNGSTDSTQDLLRREWSFPLTIVNNEHNTSFSVGNNQGAERASGDMLLFLNNDTEPVEPGWLGSMVAAFQQDTDLVAAGALLIYPAQDGNRQALTVQHAGIELRLRNRAPHAANISHPDPLAPGLRGTRDVKAVTAAALMVTRAAFDEIGGFNIGYVYGAEDVDLCLRLGRLGRIVVVGDAALFHHESATQREEARELIRINRIGNWQLFAEHWGPTLTRSILRWGIPDEATIQGGAKPIVAITLTQNDSRQGWGDHYTAHELGDAFEAAGWRVVYAERYQAQWYELDDEVNLVIALLDSYDVRRAPESAYTVAWVRNWVERWIDRPWFGEFDLVAVSSHKGAAAIRRASDFDPVVVPLATSPDRFKPGPATPTFNADYAFTGNNWGRSRDLINLLDVRPDERFLLFGKGWESEGRVARYWRGHLDYELLPELYRSVRLILDDTASHTLPHAFVNGRVFDALASGSLVLTNNVEGSDEIFDGALPTYTSRAELREQLDRYLGNDELRKRTVEQLRARVLEEYTYTHARDRLTAAINDAVDRPRVAFKIGVPSAEQVEQWGDTHFARSMGGALRSLGLETEIHILPEWDRPDRQNCDIVVHIRGLTTYTPKPAHLNVLWVISHPDDLSPREWDKYDLVLIGSRGFATELAAKTSTPVVYMPQATNGERFRPTEPVPELATEVLFVGNSRGQRRPAVDWAIAAGLPLSVYGSGWEGLIPSEYIAADNFPNERLASLYASAAVVINDHWPDMREHGFISNRIFDVLGAGGIVVSDTVDGLSHLFGDLVPTYGSATELKDVVEGLLSDPELRSSIRGKATEMIHAEHTFDHRAAQFMDLVRPMLTGRSKDLDGRSF